jgi:hypothetical protein
MRAVRPAIVPERIGIGLAIALAMGIVIGFVDSRPGWDDTGITVVSLLLASGVAAGVAGRVPWLIALATGIWVPLFELSGLASGGPVLAVAFSGLGAAIGWLAARRP